MNVCNTFYLCVLLYWCALTGQTDGGQKLLSNSVTRTLHLHTLWHPLTFYGTRFGTDANTNTNCNNNIPQNPPKNRLPFCRFPTNPWQVILPHLALFFPPQRNAQVNQTERNVRDLREKVLSRVSPKRFWINHFSWAACISLTGKSSCRNTRWFVGGLKIEIPLIRKVAKSFEGNCFKMGGTISSQCNEAPWWAVDESTQWPARALCFAQLSCAVCSFYKWPGTPSASGKLR